MQVLVQAAGWARLVEIPCNQAPNRLGPKELSLIRRLRRLVLYSVG